MLLVITILFFQLSGKLVSLFEFLLNEILEGLGAFMRFKIMNNSRNKLIHLGIIIAIIALQIMVICYWAKTKQNYFIDELYTMEQARCFNGEVKITDYITSSNRWEFNKWIDNSTLKELLVIQEKGKLFNIPFSAAVRKIILGRNYNGLVNIAMSIGGYDIVTSRPTLALNLCLLVITEICLYSLLGKLKLGYTTKCYALAMFGFSAYMISVTNYIRFYSLVALFIVLLLRLLYNAWTDDSIYMIVIYEIVIFCIAFLSLKDSELTGIYFGAISSCFIIACIFYKKWRQLIPYVLLVAVGVIYIAAKTEYLDVILHFDKYSGGSVTVGVVNNLRNIKIENVFEMLCFIIKILTDRYFGSFGVLVFSCLLLSLFFLRYNNKSNINNEKTVAINFDLTNIVILKVWIVLLAFSVLLQSGVTGCLFSLALLLIIYCRSIMPSNLNDKEGGYEVDDNAKFIGILLGSYMMYSVFIILSRLDNWRYYIFAFIVFQIIFWFFVDRLMKKVLPAVNSTRLYLILSFCVFLCVITPFFTRNIEFIYEDDAELKNIVENYNDMDTIVLTTVVDVYGTSTHETYDCINQMSGAARLYVVDLDNYNYDNVDFTSSFLLWAHRNNNIDAVISDLVNDGYKVDKLGVNHISCVYLCEKTS